MAACRAIMLGDYHVIPVDANSFIWSINFTCEKLDGSGEFFDVNTRTMVMNTDTAATTMSKIIDSAVAAVTAHGDTLARTATYLITFTRGS